jgi:hypothetical protein
MVVRQAHEQRSSEIIGLTSSFSPVPRTDAAGGVAVVTEPLIPFTAQPRNHRQQGALDNTYIFFACDNGYHLGQHRLPPGKREIFQHDINVPLIVMGPGITRGSVVPGMAQNIDLTLTWAELAGTTPTTGSPPVDGKCVACKYVCVRVCVCVCVCVSVCVCVCVRS